MDQLVGHDVVELIAVGIAAHRQQAAGGPHPRDEQAHHVRVPAQRLELLAPAEDHPLDEGDVRIREECRRQRDVGLLQPHQHVLERPARAIAVHPEVPRASGDPAVPGIAPGIVSATEGDECEQQSGSHEQPLTLHVHAADETVRKKV